jgi:hypothetical protein
MTCDRRKPIIVASFILLCAVISEGHTQVPEDGIRQFTAETKFTLLDGTTMNMEAAVTYSPDTRTGAVTLAVLRSRILLVDAGATFRADTSEQVLTAVSALVSMLTGAVNQSPLRLSNVTFKGDTSVLKEIAPRIQVWWQGQQAFAPPTQNTLLGTLHLNIWGEQWWGGSADTTIKSHVVLFLKGGPLPSGVGFTGVFEGGRYNVRRNAAGAVEDWLDTFFSLQHGSGSWTLRPVFVPPGPGLDTVFAGTLTFQDSRGTYKGDVTLYLRPDGIWDVRGTASSWPEQGLYVIEGLGRLQPSPSLER